MSDSLSYKKAGVNIDEADATKRAMAKSLATSDPRVLNRIGAFASLYDGRFPNLAHPVLVMKTEEPGSKQKLAFQNGRVRGICYDMINHLVNDIIVMGATPLAVQDCIVCGKLQKEVVNELVDSLAAACREQDCTLTGGETSEQPGVIEAGTYILTSSIVGVADKSALIDGSRIVEGDVVLAAASNGPHTNGYSLIRALMAQRPEILNEKIEGESFLDAILRPHRCYYKIVRGLFADSGLHGMAHITGGGIQDNLNRILPGGLDAAIDLGAVEILPLFKTLRHWGNTPDADMMRTFNMGVGLTLVATAGAAEKVQSHINSQGCRCYPIGRIVKGGKKVTFSGQLKW